MKHARSDYDRFYDPWGKIPADEPVFLLRGQDLLASKAVEYYAFLCAQQAKSLNNHLPDLGKELEKISKSAFDHAGEMEIWRRRKLPDMPDGA